MKPADSLGRRLLLAASGFIAVALVIAAVVIGFVLHRFVQGQIDQRLDTQITFLASMLHGNGAGELSPVGTAASSASPSTACPSRSSPPRRAPR
jgi:hypothetical protein